MNDFSIPFSRVRVLRAVDGCRWLHNCLMFSLYTFKLFFSRSQMVAATYVKSSPGTEEIYALCNIAKHLNLVVVVDKKRRPQDLLTGFLSC